MFIFGQACVMCVTSTGPQHAAHMWLTLAWAHQPEDPENEAFRERCDAGTLSRLKMKK